MLEEANARHTMNVITRGENEPDRPDPDGINNEVRELGEMLTATQLPGDHERFVSIVSRLIVLYGKSDCDILLCPLRALEKKLKKVHQRG
jgi:hypothetical protein